MRPAEAFAARLGLPVRDLDLLEQALVHTSWHHEHPDAARRPQRAPRVPRRRRRQPGHLRGAVRPPSRRRRGLPERPPRRDRVDDRAGPPRRPDRPRRRSSCSARARRSAAAGAGRRSWPRRSRRSPAPCTSTSASSRSRDWLIALAAPELDAEAPIGALKSPKSRLQEYTQRRTGERPRVPARRRDRAGPREARSGSRSGSTASCWASATARRGGRPRRRPRPRRSSACAGSKASCRPMAKRRPTLPPWTAWRHDARSRGARATR